MDRSLGFYLLERGLIVVMAVAAQKGLGLKRWSFLYLALIPFLVFFHGDFKSLVFGLAMGLLLHLSWRSWVRFLVFGLVVMAVVWWPLRLEAGRLPVEIGIVNQQRGEHLVSGETRLGKWFHNKTDLGYFMLMRVEEAIGPVKLLAAGEMAFYNRYWPLGYLFWWDGPFLLAALVAWWKKKGKTIDWNKAGVIFLGLLTIAFRGRSDEGWVVMVVFGLAIVVIKQMNRLRARTFGLVLSLDVLTALALMRLSWWMVEKLW